MNTTSNMCRWDEQNQVSHTSKTILLLIYVCLVAHGWLRLPFNVGFICMDTAFFNSLLGFFRDAYVTSLFNNQCFWKRRDVCRSEGSLQVPETQSISASSLRWDQINVSVVPLPLFNQPRNHTLRNMTVLNSPLALILDLYIDFRLPQP